MQPIRFDDTAQLNAVLWGDPQISPLQPVRAERLRAACETLDRAPGRLDVLAVLGDVAEFGRRQEYASAAAALRFATKKAAHIFCVTGNHDIRLRRWNNQRAVFNAFLGAIPNAHTGPADRYYFDARINGCRILCLGADRTKFEASYLSRRQLVWIEARLFEAQKAGEPTLVFNHQALRRTNGLPHTWEGRGDWRGSVGMQSDRLRASLEGHGDVFFCTGHLHHGITAPNYERSGRLHMISAPTVSCENHGEDPTPGQGYVLSLYGTRAVLRGADFINGVFMDETLPGAYTEIALDPAR